MVQLFDKYNHFEIPTFSLCNPDCTELCSVLANNRNVILRYNDVSELTFSVSDKYIDSNGESVYVQCYDKIVTRRLILVEDVGYFQIVDVADSDNGVSKTKNVTCRSIQYELSGKSIDYLKGTYKFYDAVNNYDANNSPVSIIGCIMQYIPDWSIGTVDSVLFDKHRTFDVSSKSLLDFIYNDIEQAYQCIVEFDILNKSISFISIDTLVNTPYNTDIYLSFENLTKNIQIEERSDEIKTKLFVYGQDLNIRQVNPIGTAYIINIDHYLNTEWMSQSLIDSVNVWKNKISNYMDESINESYANKLTALNVLQAALLNLKSDLTDLLGNLKSQNNLMSVKIQQGLDYSDIKLTIDSINVDIAAKNTEIANKETAIQTLKEQISVIVNDCKLENNFTSNELSILNKYLYEDTYTNENYIVTDLMTPVNIQNYAQELYNESVIVLQRMSQPKYLFSVDASNFIFIKDYLTFTNQLEVGRILNIENNNGDVFVPVLLELTYNYDNPDDFNMTFGNRFRLTDNVYIYNELINESKSTSSQVNANWDSLISFSKNYKNEVNNLINNAFNVALKEIISSANQEMIWDSSGMTFRKWISENGAYEDEQIKIINNKIVFTDDAWNSIKTVIGKIALTGGGTAYGVAAETIIGRLLAGVNLVITNANNTFKIDEDGFSFIVPSEVQGGSDANVKLTDYISNELDNLETSIEGLIDGKINSYYQDTLPHNQFTDVLNNNSYNVWVGDIWYNTGYTDGIIKSNNTYIYQKTFSGSNYNYTWKEIEAVPDTVFDKIDTKKTVFVSTSNDFTPSTPYATGDLWSKGDYNDGELMVCIRSRDSGNYNSSDWSNSNKYSDNLSSFINNTYTPAVSAIEGLIDSKINTFYQSSAPDTYILGVLSNSNVSAYKLALSRLGDIWYNTADKKAYMYSCNPATGNTRTFSWVVDNSVPMDLLDKIDTKKTVFVSTSNDFTPSTPYATGDLWSKGDYNDGELMVCIRSRDSGNYNSSDWIASGNYSQQLTNFIEGSYTQKINEIEGAIDGMIISFYQSSAPDTYIVGELNRATNQNDFYIASKRLGDIWYDTNIQKAKVYSCNPTTGNIRDFLWVIDENVPNGLYDAIDGKKTIFLSINEDYRPNPPYHKGDMWAQGNYQDKKLLVSQVDNLGNFNASDWIPATSQLDRFISDTYQPQIDNKISSYYQSLAPYENQNNVQTTDINYAAYNSRTGDIWYDTSRSKSFIYTKTAVGGNFNYSWNEIEAVPDNLYDKIDGKNQVFFGISDNLLTFSYRYLSVIDTFNISSIDLFGIDDLDDNAVNKFINAKINRDSGRLVYNSDYYTVCIPCVANYDYQIAKNKTSSVFIVGSYNTQNISSSGDITNIVESNSDIFIYRTSNTARYILINYYNRPQEQFLENIILGSIQVCKLEFPSVPYQIGDMWIQGRGGNMYVCIHSRDISEQFNENDWSLSSKYTDDTTISNFISTTYAEDKISLQSQIDGKAETWYQNTNPETSWTTNEIKDRHIGDIWFNTEYNYGNIKPNKSYIYQKSGNTYSWSEIDGVPDSVFDKIDGKSSIYISKPSAYMENDMWIIGEDINLTDIPTGCTIGDIVVSGNNSTSYNKSHWSKKVKYTDNTELETFITNRYEPSISNIEGIIDSRINTFYQTTSPEGYDIGEIDKANNSSDFNLALARLGDIWYDIYNKKAKVYSCNPSTGDIRTFSWRIDRNIPLDLFDKIDGKKSIYSKRPNSFSKDDMWIYEGAYNNPNNLNSDLIESDYPISNNYIAPYTTLNGERKYFSKNDLLVATSDYTSYNPTLWKKYNTNIEKSNDDFEFTLNDNGVKIANGELIITRSSGKSKILISPDDGIKIQKDTSETSTPSWNDQFYADANGNICITGIITANEGSIGDWTIGEYKLSANSNNVGLYSGVAVTDYQSESLLSGSGNSAIRIWAGSPTPSSAKFKLLDDGSLYAEAATISGTINANAGYLKDMYIDGKLYLNDINSGGYWLSGTDASYRINMYNTGSSYFRVDVDGAMSCANATISGTINANAGLMHDINVASGLFSKIFICDDATVQYSNKGGIIKYIYNTNDTTNNGIYIDASSNVDDGISNNGIIKILSGSNMSIDAGNGGTIYIGTTKYPYIYGQTNYQTIEIGTKSMIIEVDGVSGLCRASRLEFYGESLKFNDKYVLTAGDLTFQ